MYTKDTSAILDEQDADIALTHQDHEDIIPSGSVEYFECQKCSEFNAIKSKPERRRTTRVRHLRLDNVTYASLKRYAILNNTTINYAILLLLHNARTSNVSYIINERKLVEKTETKKSKKKGI